VKLKSLTIGVDGPAAQHVAGEAVSDDIAGTLCHFCGLTAGLHGMRIGQSISCVLCGLAQSLHRTTIDEEVRLIWLPEMSQPALNVLVRQIHIDLQVLGESVFCDDNPSHPGGMRTALYTAQRILRERSDAIVEKLGSSRASDLADALTVLSARHVDVRNLPWGGLRAFPTGRFFVGGLNVYDEIVASWRGVPTDERATESSNLVKEVA
jgi:hypothetical protein